MIPALEALALLIVLSAALLLYRRLIHSTRFSKLVADVARPSPESDEEVLLRLDTAENVAKRRAMQADRQATRNQKTAATIRRRINRHPKPKPPEQCHE